MILYQQAEEILCFGVIIRVGSIIFLPSHHAIRIELWSHEFSWLDFLLRRNRSMGGRNSFGILQPLNTSAFMCIEEWWHLLLELFMWSVKKLLKGGILGSIVLESLSGKSMWNWPKTPFLTQHSPFPSNFPLQFCFTWFSSSFNNVGVPNLWWSCALSIQSVVSVRCLREAPLKQPNQSLHKLDI